jgi:hypothetical protein
MLTKNGALAALSGIAGLAAIGSFIAAKDPRTCYQHDVLAWTTCTDVQSQYMSGAIVLGLFAAFGLSVAAVVRARRKKSQSGPNAK